MLRTNVLVAATSLDIQAETIAVAIAARNDMSLIASRVLTVSEIGEALESLPLSLQCALVIVGPRAETAKVTEHWLEARKELVVLRVDIFDDVVRIQVRDLNLDSLLAALRQLVDHASGPLGNRVSQFQLWPGSLTDKSDEFAAEPQRQPLLYRASINWIHAVLRNGLEKMTCGEGDFPGLAITTSSVKKLLEAPTEFNRSAAVMNANRALSQEMKVAGERVEPLATAMRVFELSPIEFRILLLTLAPELDPRYQRCMGLMLDDLGRRVGTLGLYSGILGDASVVRREIAQSGNLARWRVFHGHSGSLPPADEPLRLDPWFVGWLLGEQNALAYDPRVREAMRLLAWPGAGLLDRVQELNRALNLVSKLQFSDDAHWILLTGNDPPGWRAVIELGAQALNLPPLRIVARRLIRQAAGEIEEAGVRIGRMARLTGCPLVVDAIFPDDNPQDDDCLADLFAAVGSTGCRAAVISKDESRIVRLLGPAHFEINDVAQTRSSRVASVQAAAIGSGTCFTEHASEAIINQYPLQIDGLEQLMRIALKKPLASKTDELLSNRFLVACKQVAAEGASHLSERIEPVFRLEDVVLPIDRKQQLEELVDNVRLAPEVLDGWKFREGLPYGRGVTALFHGPSGTGKTMAALGVANKLGIQLLRIDLSRVVSKYIGDTEKNIDRVFLDAQKSGAAILIDEADALLGKRSEVKDAHDRYANIEVAYLLQRMEAYDGLAVLTTNLKQNLDPAFLRRLRFIVDFPRPDADSREMIWRRCLPDESHELDDAAFRQIARKIDLTGGHIRQITLRAAFVAAAGESKIGIDHIAHAVRAEFAKLGLPAVELSTVERRKAA